MRASLQNQEHNRVHNACFVYTKRFGFAAYHFEQFSFDR